MAIETLRLIRYGALALIAILVLGWIAVGLGVVDVGGRAPVEGKFAIGSPVVGSFKLTDQNGQTVTEADVVGRPSVVFFGFIYCPEVCPTTMASLCVVFPSRKRCRSPAGSCPLRRRTCAGSAT